MRIISKRKLREFWEKNSISKQPLEDWYKAVKKVDWNGFVDVRAMYNSSDIYKACVIFNIGGNKFRLITKINYQKKKVFIRFVGSHKDYDKDDWKKDCEC
jgi:mRNA interferase HigB